ncbi:Conserved protein of uncharacterised function (part1) [Mycobacterium tuberculosis]|uniref:Conserved protein of uncharacterized function (Part1) n=1 Tax=Mycobacterium tuberculosis TaxID=1773 RepID=A0A655CBR7_MYCTX|nr:Conserved protein of uncharacterised function (part1) [Mycobacterium tuberculosis]CNU02377.1 Conserved protein of uncharacterised function (part1) [Mycobacterium tuberculosis]CNU04621.1 Conserved protein of uncharacterised function (part1) [Mycobacterium tuberculosis]CNU06704.1 Conserved protein of uncharacterised function (part1) [Mycobacterium tuberculosis]CNU80745.1 Conserved protein of uncharacterised function (part1) [Mycobacterium tuberculosis]
MRSRSRCGGWTARSWKSKPTSPQGCRVCIWWVCPMLHCRSPATGSARRSPIAETAGRWPGSRSRCRRRRCRKWARSTTSPWPRRCCRRNKRSRGNVWRTRCCWVNCRWTDGCVRCVGCCPPCWQPNVTVGRPSSFRPTTCPRPAWWTESTSGVFARWGSCRAGYAGPPAWPGGSPRPTPPPSLRRTSPMWWASPKHGSPSRWPPPGRITSC